MKSASIANILFHARLTLESLAAGDQPFEKLLYDVYNSHLMHIIPDNVPADLASEFKWIQKQCEHYHPKGAGYMKAIPESKQRKIAEKLTQILIRSAQLELTLANRHSPRFKK
ncbi:MAG: hypothetical protein B9S32_12855 [Verrucomicrobia bacterium Tous-C9LFEB]|nr:MAG: hypothetical protein B9S32_12855 [Verrucomicrobia bacterium Tous-C9LFEB]